MTERATGVPAGGSPRPVPLAALLLLFLAGCAGEASPPLAGLSGEAVIALYGEPDFRRTDPPAALWQYRGADCVLDLFLYPEAGAYRVIASQAHQRGAVAAPDEACLTAATLARTRQSRL
jgi:hypothetical protein